MKHDPSKVLLGSVKSSHREIDSRDGSIAAGLAVRLKSDGTISSASADGSLLGISVGSEMSGIGRTSICRKGLEVPVLLADEFTPVVGAQVHLSNTTGEAMASGAGATGVNAIYRSAVLDGIAEDGSSKRVAYIDFQGGL